MLLVSIKTSQVWHAWHLSNMPLRWLIPDLRIQEETTQSDPGNAGEIKHLRLLGNASISSRKSWKLLLILQSTLDIPVIYILQNDGNETDGQVKTFNLLLKEITATASFSFLNLCSSALYSVCCSLVFYPSLANPLFTWLTLSLFSPSWMWCHLIQLPAVSLSPHL